MRFTDKHPLATATKARIDLFTSGMQSVIMKDSLMLAEQSLTQMKRGEHILILNSLASSAVVERVADKLCERTDAKIMTFTASGAKLREKLEFLRLTIIAKNVKLLIVNSWDFAALGSRQKHALVHWMRELRDESGVRIVVYCASDVTPFGALTLLAWSADTVSKCGEWQTNPDWNSGTMPNANNAADEYLAKFSATDVKQEREASVKQEREASVKQEREPSVKKGERRQPDVFVDLPASSLKNKDLTPARTHLEEEYAMAA